jgi:hypothetical protein
MSGRRSGESINFAKRNFQVNDGRWCVCGREAKERVDAQTGDFLDGFGECTTQKCGLCLKEC